MLLQRLALRAAVACALLLAPAYAYAWEGIASTYGREIFRINPGGRTANGERFKPMGRTAAMWDVPFNTRMRVTHLATGRSIVVRVNDRGPQPIAPNGTLIRDGERLRTLELDELAPLRLRFTIHF